MTAPIKGYRKLSELEISLMNEGKEVAILVGAFIEKLEAIPAPTSTEDVSIDKRWLAIGKTDLQKGFMSALRSIARPETF